MEYNFYKMTHQEVDRLAQKLWDYMRMDMQPKPADIIFVLCSFDARVAEYAAQLFKRGYGQYIVFSGNGQGRRTEELFGGVSEAETFARIAYEAGVPKEKVLLEDQANNTGENITFTARLLAAQGLRPRSLLLVQKPYGPPGLRHLQTALAQASAAMHGGGTADSL